MQRPSSAPITETREPFVPARRILVVNDGAGAGDVPLDYFEGFEVVDIAEADRHFRDSPPDGTTLVAVWGGDGTCRSIAELLVGTSAVLLPCPGGTHNHFARAAGLAEVDDVLDALTNGDTVKVDIGFAGGRVFLNNANFGWYVDLVTRRERYGTKMHRRLAKLLSMVVQAWTTTTSTVTVNGVPERAWMVWIGNGEYSLEPTALVERPDLNDGVLDVRVLRSHSRAAKLRALMSLLLGTTESSPSVRRWLTGTCSLRFSGPEVRAALDGELVTLVNPVDVTCVRNHLRLATPSNVERPA